MATNHNRFSVIEAPSSHALCKISAPASPRREYPELPDLSDNPLPSYMHISVLMQSCMYSPRNTILTKCIPADRTAALDRFPDSLGRFDCDWLHSVWSVRLAGLLRHVPTLELPIINWFTHIFIMASHKCEKIRILHQAEWSNCQSTFHLPPTYSILPSSLHLNKLHVVYIVITSLSGIWKGQALLWWSHWQEVLSNGPTTVSSSVSPFHIKTGADPSC